MLPNKQHQSTESRHLAHNGDDGYDDVGGGGNADGSHGCIL